MRRIEKYLLTNAEMQGLREVFVPLAFLIGDDDRARVHINRVLGNMSEYTEEQRNELIDAVRDVCNETRKQASIQYWAEMPFSDSLAQMRHNEYVKLFAILLSLTGEEA